MNEDFVPSEFAKKLKEKGFKEECLCHYISNDIVYNIESPIANYQMWFCHNKYDNIWHRDNIDAPTTSQVLKWLREEKGILIEVSPVFRTCKFSSTIYYTKNCQFIKHFAKLSKNYDSYEEAVIDKMDFVIDRLI